MRAKVTDDSPLTVRFKGATVDTAVQEKASSVPALVVGDDVLVEIDDRKVIVLAKVVAA